MSVYEEAASRSRNYEEASARPRPHPLHDLDGKVHEEDADGLFATCIQHEIDHPQRRSFRRLSVEAETDPRRKKFAKAAKRAASRPHYPPSWRADPGIHAFSSRCTKYVDGRDKPGHDGIH